MSGSLNTAAGAGAGAGAGTDPMDEYDRPESLRASTDNPMASASASESPASMTASLSEQPRASESTAPTAASTSEPPPEPTASGRGPTMESSEDSKVHDDKRCTKAVDADEGPTAEVVRREPEITPEVVEETAECGAGAVTETSPGAADRGTGTSACDVDVGSENSAKLSSGAADFRVEAETTETGSAAEPNGGEERNEQKLPSSLTPGEVVTFENETSSGAVGVGDSKHGDETSSNSSSSADDLPSPTRTVTAAEAAILAGKSAAVKINPRLSSDQNDVPPERVVTFEEAVRLTGQGRFHNVLLLVSGCLAMAAVMETVVVGYLLPSATCELGMTPADKGLLGAASYVGIVLSSHTWGLVADTQGRRAALLWATALDVVCSLASSLAPNFTTLLVLRFFCGVFTSAPAALSFAYLGEFHTPATRSRSIIWIGAFPSIGLIILPGVAWAVLPQSWSVDLGFIEFGPWRLLLVLCALLSLLSAVLLLALMPESPKFLSTPSRDPAKALAVLRRMYAQNTGNPPEKYPVDGLVEADAKPLTKESLAAMESAVKEPKKSKESKSSMGLVRGLRLVWGQTAPLLMPPYILHTLLVCVIQFGNLSSANGLQIWLPEIFNRLAMYESAHPDEGATICGAMSADPSGSAGAAGPGAGGDPTVCIPVVKEAVFINNLIIGAVSLAMPLLCGMIVNIVGKRNLLVLCMLVTGALGVSLTLAPSSSIVLGMSSVIVAINAMGIGHISSIVVELFPTNLRAMAVSLHFMCGRAGSIVGNLIFGALLNSHCPYAFYLIGGTLLTCSVLSCFLPARGKYAA